MIDGHPPGAVLTRVHGHPLVGVLGHLVEVRREDVHLRAVVAGLGRKVAVRRARHVQVRAHDRQQLRVVPVGGLLHVGLLAPGLRRGVGQVAVPVVEGKGHAAHQLQHPRSRRVADHRHGWNRREAGDAIRAVLLGGVEVRRGHDVQDRIPVRAPQSPLASRALPGLAGDVVLDERGPGRHRIGVRHARDLPPVEQGAADVGVLHAQRAVEVPGVGDAALAAARLVGRQALLEQGVVQTLHLPGDDPVLDVDVPGAAARAVHAVGAAHDLVVLPAVPVELLPAAGFRRNLVLDPGNASVAASHAALQRSVRLALGSCAPAAPARA